MILGDIPKVTPSSKVVGDLAQFMVAQDLETKDVLDQAETLAFPDSVVNFLKGDIGIPPGGFPEPLRTKVLTSRGLEPVNGRPGTFIKDYDFDLERDGLQKMYGESHITDKELLSYALYPNVFTEWKEFEAVYGNVELLPTHLFLNPMKVGQEVEIDLGPGNQRVVKLVSIGDVSEEGSSRVLLEVDGENIYFSVTDHSAVTEGMIREKAKGAQQVGSPMPGVVVNVKVKAGDKIKEGDVVATLSAMKMETSIPATATGIVTRVAVNVGDKVEGNDLLVEIE
jgi:pyruvate carboxylase